MDGIMVVVDRLGRSIVELEQVNAQLQERIKELEAAAGGDEKGSRNGTVRATSEAPEFASAG